MKAIPGKKGLFKVLEGELTAEHTDQAIMENDRGGEVPRAKRNFCGDGEVFTIGGKTYVLTNQWGNKAMNAARKLAEAFPNLKIEVNPTASP